MKISSFLSYHLQNKKRSHEQNPFLPLSPFSVICDTTPTVPSQQSPSSSAP